MRRDNNGVASTNVKMDAPRIAALDGLRTMAISIVLLGHFWSFPSGDVVLNRLFDPGWMGVDLFFVLSGFLITSILLRTRQDANYFRNFYARRVLRIFPAYYLLLLIVLVVVPIFRPLKIGVSKDSWMYWLFLGNFALAHGWQMLRIDITWTLAIEEQFYIIWSVVVRYISSISPLCIIICVIAPIARFVLWEAGVSWLWLHMMTPLRADAFAWGALVALRPYRYKVLSVLIVPLVLLCAANRYGQATMFVSTVGYSLNAACAAGLISLALCGGRFARVLAFRPVAYVGKISYGIYLYHPICFLVVTYLVHIPRDTMGGLMRILIVAPTSIAIAAASYHLFEQPILGLKSRFSLVRKDGVLEST